MRYIHISANTLVGGIFLQLLPVFFEVRPSCRSCDSMCKNFFFLQFCKYTFRYHRSLTIFFSKNKKCQVFGYVCVSIYKINFAITICTFWWLRKINLWELKERAWSAEGQHLKNSLDFKIDHFYPYLYAVELGFTCFTSIMEPSLILNYYHKTKPFNYLVHWVIYSFHYKP